MPTNRSLCYALVLSVVCCATLVGCASSSKKEFNQKYEIVERNNAYFSGLYESSFKPVFKQGETSIQMQWPVRTTIQPMFVDVPGSWKELEFSAPYSISRPHAEIAVLPVKGSVGAYPTRYGVVTRLVDSASGSLGDQFMTLELETDFRNLRVYDVSPDGSGVLILTQTFDASMLQTLIYMMQQRMDVYHLYVYLVEEDRFVKLRKYRPSLESDYQFASHRAKAMGE